MLEVVIIHQLLHSHEPSVCRWQMTFTNTNQTFPARAVRPSSSHHSQGQTTQGELPSSPFLLRQKHPEVALLPYELAGLWRSKTAHPFVLE